MPIAHYGALLLLLPCPNFSRKYRKSPSPLCALSKLADIVVNPSKNSILMKRKTPISTRARLKSPNNPPRGRYRTGGLGSAALKVQQTSEAQFHGLLEENPDAIIIVDRTGHINFASNRIEAMFGYLANELFGKPLSVLIPERYRDLHLGHLDRFMSDPKPRMMGVGLELRALRKDGSEFPTEISLSPHPTPNGLVVVAAIRDIEAAKRAQRLLLRELHHRVKNTLATVMAITSQSLRTAQNLEEGRLAVESRLVALGRAHDLLLQENSTGAKLTDVIRDAIEPFDSHDVQRFIVQDTNIDIGAGVVLPLTMSLNELCTNAVKYGALSNTTGRIDITSTVDEKVQRFKLTWTEKGGPAVQEPTRRSFGTRLIGRLAEQLQGDVRLRYEPTGVVYELDIPLAVLRAPAIDM
jgi:PAS domain S-box-containing protein